MHPLSRKAAPDFRCLFDSRMAGVFSWTPDGAIDTANATFLTMTSRQAEELGKLSWSDIAPGQDVPMNGDVEVVRADGSRAILAIDVVAAADHERPGVGLALDVTSQRSAEDALGKTQSILESTSAEHDLLLSETERHLDAERRGVERLAFRLANANRELEAFSYSVSHDLRTPLRSIDGFSRALQSMYADKLDERGADYLNRIRNAAQRMSRLIDDVLKLARLSRTAIRTVDVDLSEEAREILEEMQRNEPQRDVTWTIEPDLHAQGDQSLLRLVLENVLGNAWKFTSRREQAHIHVGRKESEAGPVFFIRDDGAGFDMAYAGNLFGAFQRLHTLQEFEGTGIGLATVRRILHLHDGDIRAEGRVDGGATFYFTIGGHRAPSVASSPTPEGTRS